MNPVFEPCDHNPFETGEISDVAPATAAQTEIWVASQFGDEAALAYNESITIELRGSLDRTAIERAISALPRRHEALRSTFSHDGKVLCVGAATDVPITWSDAHQDAPPEQEKRLGDLIATEVTTPFDLERGPLLRATVVRMGEEDHRVILGSHHIVCDGWSFAALLKDLGAIYAAAKGAVPGVVPESLARLSEAHAYSTYAREEATRDASREERYWRGVFEPVPAPLDLPTDKARPALRSFRSARLDRHVGKELTSQLKKAGAKSGASLFVTLFSAFGVLMSRLSGQNDLVIGVPASAQSALGREMLVGHCANLLPIRAQFDNEAPFAELLKAVRGKVLDAYDHQRFTLGAILPTLSLPRDPSRLPLVQVLFNLDTGMEGAGGLFFDDLTVRFRGNPRVAETFELFLNVFESHGTLALECQYSTALWHQETIEAWLDAYLEMLRQVAASPETLCKKLPLLSAEDRRRLLVDVNATARSYPTDATVLELFAKQVEAHPDKTAVSGEGGALTYAALQKAARKVAWGLQKRGIQPGDHVALSVSRSPNMVAALLGILKAGAAYIPVDPRYPSERIAPMLNAAKLTIVEPATASSAEALGAVTVHLDDLLATDLPGAEAAHNAPPKPEDIAYVLFTSGSTGVPNGVQVTHKNLVNFIESMRADPGMTSSDVLVAVVTLSFDIAGYELYVPLASGASIVIADTDTAADGRELGALIERSGATVLQAPPSTYRLLRTAGYAPKGLKALAGGELLPVDLARWLIDGGATLINCYGPTETTIWSTIHHVTGVDGPIPLGRPIANTRLYILDAHGEPRPVGAYGEIYIGGDGVTRGYLDRPEVTALRFVPDPFSDTPGAQLHRTGDVGRLRHDGILEFLGRNDDQVKIRGHRIELGEVESALASHPHVAEAAAALVRDPGADPRLAAFIVPKKGEDVTPTDARRHLKKRLPEAMIPQLVIEISSVPRTPNGKIDRRALARLGAGHRPKDREITPPETPMERLVVDLCERAVGPGAQFGTTDNFFEGGGDSLKCMSIVVEIETKTGVRIAPRALILSSLGDVAKLIEKGIAA